jgi:hypothetical protein
MTANISRAAAEQVQREIREATGQANLPVLDVMVRSGAWVLKDEVYAAPLGMKGVV